MALACHAEEGDQQRFWKLTKRFVDSLAEADPQCTIRIVSFWSRSRQI